MKKLILTILLLCWPVGAWGATHTVNTDAEMDTALAALADNDTIIINASFASAGANYIIAKAGVTVYGTLGTEIITKGVNGNLITISGDSGSVILRDFKLEGDGGNYTGHGILLEDPNCEIRGMTVNAMEDIGIHIGTQAGTIVDNCTVTDNGRATGGTQTCLFASNGANNLTINKNTLTCSTSASKGDGIELYRNINTATVTNNTIVGANGHGIDLNATDATAANRADDVVISGNTVTDWARKGTANAIHAEGDNITITDNDLNQNTDGFTAWGIEVNVYAVTGTIYNNRIGGAHLDRAIAGGGADGAWTVYDNELKANDRVVSQQSFLDWVFYNNILICNGGGYGFFLQCDGAGRTITLYNNTIVDINGTTTGIYFAEDGGAWTIVLTNNIIEGFTTGVMVEDEDNNGITLANTYNNYFDNTTNLYEEDTGGGASGAIALDATELTVNPRFIRAGGTEARNYTPKNPDMYKGTSGGSIPTTDYFGIKDGIIGAIKDTRKLTILE